LRQQYVVTFDAIGVEPAARRKAVQVRVTIGDTVLTSEATGAAAGIARDACPNGAAV
jgi:hypothetical protein